MTIGGNSLQAISEEMLSSVFKCLLETKLVPLVKVQICIVVVINPKDSTVPLRLECLYRMFERIG